MYNKSIPGDCKEHLSCVRKEHHGNGGARRCSFSSGRAEFFAANTLPEDGLCEHPEKLFAKSWKMGFANTL